MKIKIYLKTMSTLLVKCFFLICFITTVLLTANANAQTTLTTNFANNNGSSVAVFSFNNNSASPVIINSIGSVAGATATYSCYLYVHSATYGVAPGAAPAITAANGWSVIGSNTSLPLTINTTGSGNTATTFISGMNYSVPAFTQVRLCLQLATGAGLPAFTTAVGNIRYSTITAGPFIFSGGGCDITFGSNYAYAGTMASPTNTPRGFIGFVTFSPSTPCSGTPAPGNTISSANPVCSGSNFILSLQNSTSGTGVTYQWQSSPDNSTWTNFGSGAATQGTSQTSATYYRCIVSCSGNPGTSTPVLVGMNAFFNCYCIPTTTNGCASGDHITNVTFNSITNPINNTTGACISGGSYSNYTGTIPAAGVTTGDVVSVSVSVNNGGTEYAGGWIDFDHSGTFDAGEFISLSDADGFAPWIYNGSITIPPGALTGTTGLRFRSSYSAVIASNSACSTYSYGETEDYLITIAANANCSGAPNAGTISGPAAACPGASFSITASGLSTGTGITYQWQSASSCAGPFTDISGATSSTLSASQNVATSYRLITTCSFSSSSTSNCISVGMTAVDNCYCTPVHTAYDGTDYISNVSITGTSLNNASGATPNPSYTNYCPGSGNTTATLLTSTSYTINITSGSFTADNFAAWIDFNHNGIFEVGEQLGQTLTPGAFATFSYTFTVPAGATAGVTRLRVVNQDGFNPVLSCPVSGYGETEDYCITIAVPAPCSGTPAPGNTTTTSLQVCPAQSFTLGLQNSTGGTGVSYQWQSSPNNSTWTNITAATSSTLTTTESAATYYRCVVTCSAGGTGFSNSIQIGFTSGCYCTTPVYINNGVFPCSTGYNLGLTNFTFAGINNTTGCNSASPYITFFLNQVASVQQTQTYTLSFTGGQPSFLVSFNIFIDFNDNGSMDDPGEQIVATGNVAGGPAPYSATWTVPLTAPLGTHRLRIRSADAGIVNSCSTDGNVGEAEDYMVTINPPPPCSGTPTPGNTIASTSLACVSQTINLSLQNATAGSGVTYQWQRANDAGFTSGVVNLGTSNTQSTTETADSYYRCIVTCSANSGTSTPVLVSYSVPCYCTTPVYTSGNGCPFGIEADNFTFAGINNITGCNGTAPYYQYYNLTSSVTTGITYPISITLNTSPFALTNYYYVYIDYNDNGSFDDGGELIFSGTLAAVGTLSGNYTIPISAPIGIHHLRVRAAYQAVTNSCSAEGLYGEVEDYNINVTAPAPCSGTPAPGNTLSSAQNVCSSSSFTLSLQNTPSASGITYQWQSSPDNSTWSNISLATSATLSTSQATATYYRCAVTCNPSASTGFSNSLQVTMGGSCQCATYCSPVYSFFDGTDYVSSVTLNSWNRTSGNTPLPGYDNETGIATTTLQAGNTYTISVTNGSFATENLAAWIDFNQNGTFDPSEQILNGSTSSSFQTVSATFTVPGNAVGGFSRLRVMDMYSVAINPCASGSSYGETEDYCIGITVPVCSGTPSPGNTISTASNVCETSPFTLSLQNITIGSGVTYQWQSSTNAGFTSPTNLGTVSTQTIAAQPAGTMYYRCLVTCGSLGGGTGISSAVQINSTAAPSSGTISGTSVACTNTAFTLSQTVAGAGSIQWQENGVDIAGETSASLTRTLTSSGVYSYRIRYNAAGCSDAFSNTIAISVSTGPTASASVNPTAVCPGDQVTLTGSGSMPSAGAYCSTSSTFGCSGFGDEITNLTFANINRTSGCDVYVYTTSPVAPVTAGVTMPITITTGVGNLTDEGVAVWIDLNQDGTFSSGELLYSSYSGADPAVYNGTITVPTSAYNGTTRMRVECMYAQIPTDPCNNTGYGEFEDYNVTISGGTPNPTSNVTYSWTSSPAGFTASTANTTANPTVATTYILAVSGGGCTTTATTTQVTMNSAPVTIAASSSTVCNNSSSITLSSNFDGPYAVYSGPGVSGNTFNPNLVSPGNSIVTITYTPPTGCSGTASMNITVLPLPNPNATNTTLAAPKCEGITVALTASPSGSLSPYSISWSGPGFGYLTSQSITPPSNIGSPVVFSGAAGQSLPGISGPYIATVTDARGCTNTATTVLLVHSNPTVLATVTSPVCAGTSVTFAGNVDWHGETPASYAWFNPLGDNIGGGPNYTISNVSIDDAADLMALYGYPGYSFTASNAAGCSNDYGFSLHVIGAPVFDSNPGNQTANNDLGNCSAVVNYGPVTASSGEYWYTANGYGFGDEYSQPVATNVSYVFSSGPSGSGDGSGSVFNVGSTHVTITAANSCSNLNTNLDFDVNVIDAEAPVITVAAQNRIVECDGNGNLDEFNDWLITNWADADATDNCSTTEQLDTYWVNDFNESNWVHTCGNGQYVDVTFRVHDRAGNYSQPTSARFTIQDTQAPVITQTCGPVSALGCNPTSAAINTALGTATAMDICQGALMPTYVDGPVVQTSYCGRSQTRTWNVSDACGNAASAVSCTATWIEDTSTPEIELHGGTSELGCNPSEADVLFYLGYATIASNAVVPAECIHTYLETFTDDSVNVGGCRWSRTRRFHAVNTCSGHDSWATFTTYWTLDHTAPAISPITSVTVSCAEQVPAANNSIVSATDNCASVEQLMVNHDADVVTPGSCPNRYTISRTYHVADVCGNSSSVTQTITVNDVTPPTFTSVNPNITLSACTPTASWSAPTASDNCNSGVASVLQTAGPVSGSTFNNNTTTTITYTATDACGNTATQSFTVTRRAALAASTSSVVRSCGYNISCNGGSDGSIGTTGVAGGLAPYHYSWSPSGQTGATATGLAAGTYVATITDAEGCTITQTRTLSQPAVLACNAGPNENTYFGYSADQTFTHTATITGGSAPYTYRWSFVRLTGASLTPMPASTGALRCNNVNSSGDEVFNAVGATYHLNSYYTCTGVSLANYIAPAYPSDGGTIGTCGNTATTAITMTLMDTARVTLDVTDANGCTTQCSFTVFAEDARCWAGNSSIQKVTICHRSNSTCATICVDESAVSAHLAHGDVLGACRNSTSCITGRPNDGSGDMDASSYLTAYPNPFNEKTTIAFSVPKDGRAVIRIYDAVGKEIGVLFDGMAKSGEMYKVDFDGSKYAEGMYFYSITSDEMNQTKKMQLIK
jgi:hypothetical protein